MHALPVYMYLIMLQGAGHLFYYFHAVADNGIMSCSEDRCLRIRVYSDDFFGA